MRSITEGLDINKKATAFTIHAKPKVLCEASPKAWTLIKKVSTFHNKKNETRVDVRSTDAGLEINKKPKVHFL